MVEIIHLIPKRLVYGAGSMLNELDFAIDRHYSGRASQSIISLKSSSPGDGTSVDVSELRQHIEDNYSKPVVFMHKIARTECQEASGVLYGKIPFNIINHTQTRKPVGLASCDNLVCVSKHMVKCLKPRSSARNVVMIRNGVNACRFDDVAPTHNPEAQGWFKSGRLNNFNSTKHSKTWCSWVGQNPMKGFNHWHDYLGGGKMYLQAKNQAKGINKNYRKQIHKVRLELPGKINNFAEKAGIIKSWDVFLYEIVGEEGTSMSMLEALACGKPAIINNKPGNSECIGKWVNGFVCSDRKTMFDKMYYLARNRNALLDLQASTKEHFLANYDAQHMARNYIELAESMY
jgi:glycosyltransferase involved in cell wall biosynthesis